MSLVPPTDSIALGPLTISEVFFQHDGPRLFTATSQSGRQYLASCADEDEDTITYLYLPVSTTRLTGIRTGTITLRDAYLGPEDGGVYQVVANYAADPPRNEVSLLKPTNIPDDWLALEGAALRLDTETRPSFDLESLRQESSSSLNSRIALEVHPTTTRKTEYPLRALSRLTGTFQETIDALAQEDSGRPTARGLIPDEILRQTELMFSYTLAASFVLVLSPRTDDALVPSELVDNSTKRLLELLRAVDKNEIRGALSQYGRRARSKFRTLLTVLSDDDTGASLFLASRSGEVHEASVQLEAVRHSLKSIDQTNPDIRQIELARVEIVGLNLRTGSFELADAIFGERYFGQMSPEAKSQIDGLRAGTGFLYSARVQETIEYSSFGASLALSHRLLSIKPVDDDLELDLPTELEGS